MKLTSPPSYICLYNHPTPNKSLTPVISNQASILIPTLNEEEYIEDCLTSLIAGTSAACSIEILVIDGGSTDRTQSIVNSLSQRHPAIKLIHNPDRIVPAAMNIGVQQATHEYLIWCGAHAIYEPGYIENSLAVHTELECASSGGILTPVGKTRLGKAIALATKSRFGIGATPYRHATSRVSAKSVFGGCFTKATAKKAGGFNEQWVRNQDVEFNHRVRTRVGEIIVDPKIKCHYFCRDSIAGLSRQYVQYGFWRYKTTTVYPETFNFRLLAPVLLVFGLLASLLMLIFGISAAWIIPASYLLVCSLQSIKMCLTNRNVTLLFWLPIIFITIHCTWGFGFISHAARHIYNLVMASFSKNKNGIK